MGFVGQHVGPRASLVFSAVSVAVALLLWYVIRLGGVARNDARWLPGAVSSPAVRDAM